MSESAEEIGTYVREVRLRRSLTQAMLAALVGVSRQTINAIEQGNYSPSTKLALQLARALGASVEELFYLYDPAGDTPRSGGIPEHSQND